MLDTLIAFTISLLIGLLIGIERERSHPDGPQFIGVRTFILLSLLGTLIATLDQMVLTITTSTFVFSLLLLNYFRSTSNPRSRMDIAIVTEMTAGIIFFLGYMVPISPLFSITISAIILLVLIERKRLHTLARKKFKPHEIETAIILIIFTLGLLPVLPNQPIDPWQLFNPRHVGILLATIAAIQFGGYVTIHLFGERLGIALTGLMGGLVSSTIVFAQLKDTLRSHPASVLAIIAASILATVAMLVDVIVIIFVASPTLLVYIIWPLVTMIITGILFALVLLHYQTKTKHHSLNNPINLRSIFRTSLFIVFMIILIAIAKHFVSINEMLLISFLSGLVEIHGISLAAGLLYLGNQLNSFDARLVLYLAILATFVSKFILLWILTPRRFALQTSLFLLGMMASGGAVYWLEV